MSRPDLDVIERRMELSGQSQQRQDIDLLVAHCRLLEAHILDIDAHATPFGDSDADGFIQRYLLTAGALHRALGVIGHSAVPCRPCLASDDQSDDQ